MESVQKVSGRAKFELTQYPTVLVSRHDAQTPFSLETVIKVENWVDSILFH